MELAGLLQERGRFRQAIVEYETLIEHFPKEVRGYVAYAELCLSEETPPTLRNPEAAVALMREAVALTGRGDVYHRFLLARALHAHGQSNAAREELRSIQEEIGTMPRNGLTPLMVQELLQRIEGERKR